MPQSLQLWVSDFLSLASAHVAKVSIHLSAYKVNACSLGTSSAADILLEKTAVEIFYSSCVGTGTHPVLSTCYKLHTYLLLYRRSLYSVGFGGSELMSWVRVLSTLGRKYGLM